MSRSAVLVVSVATVLTSEPGGQVHRQGFDRASVTSSCASKPYAGELKRFLWFPAARGVSQDIVYWWAVVSAVMNIRV
jgi:hypothetical protein